MKLWSRYPINHKMFSFIILTGNTFIFFIAKFFFVIFFQLQTLATQPPLSLLAMNSRDYGNDHFQGQQNNIFSLRFGSFMKKKSLVFVIKQNHYSWKIKRFICLMKLTRIWHIFGISKPKFMISVNSGLAHRDHRWIILNSPSSTSPVPGTCNDDFSKNLDVFESCFWENFHCAVSRGSRRPSGQSRF